MRRVLFLMVMVCLAAFGTVDALDVDLQTDASAQATAQPGEAVTVAVDYQNNSADPPQLGIATFIWPRGGYFEIDDAFVDAYNASFTDTRTNELDGDADGPFFFINGSCDGYLSQIYNNTTETLDLPGGESGQFTLTIPMPMEQPEMATFRVDEPADLAGSYNFLEGDCNDCDDPGGASCMGTPVGLIEPISGNLVLVDDGTNETADGCEALVNGGDVAGNFAVIDRGECEFGVKVLNAFVAGATGIIIVNNEPNFSPPVMGSSRISVGPSGGTIGIDTNNLGIAATSPVVFISQEDGQPLKDALTQGTVSATIGRIPTDDVTFASNAFHYLGPAGRPLDLDRNPANDDSSATITVNYGGGPAAPEASFTFAATDLMVEFTDTSTNAPTTWAWDFGDGETSDMQNPTHTYAAAGTYTVGLTATNDGGSDTFTTDVTVTAGTGPVLDMFYFVPAAAKAEGQPGTFFVTDLAINNTGTEMATYQFLWLPRGQDNSAPDASETFMLGGGMTATYSDVLGEVFGAEDGAIGAFAVISDSADLIFMSRTFNQGADGTFGQSIPGYAMSQLIPENMRMRIIFMIQNEAYRSNLGFMNGVGSPITVNWEIFAADGTSLATGSRDIAAWSNTQINQVLNAFAPIQGAYIDVWTTTPGGLFAAYGSVLDNMTDDPTTVLPQ
jgi:PKD repeat protein